VAGTDEGARWFRAFWWGVVAALAFFALLRVTGVV
jgi:hypothetical protein